MKYVNDFKNYLIGSVNYKDVGLGAKNQLIQTLKPYIDSLRTKTAAADNWILSLTASLANIDIPSADSVKRAIDGNLCCPIEIAEEEFNDILENFKYSASGQPIASLTMVDQQGLVYSLFNQNWNGRECISSNISVNGTDDLLLWYEDGHFYINGVVKTCDYWVEGHSDDSTIYGKLMAICDWADLTVSYYANIRQLAYQICVALSAGGSSSDSISSLVSRIAAHYEVSTSGTISNILDSVINKIKLPGNYGAVSFFFDLLNNQAVSSTLNSALVDVYDVISSTATSIDNIVVCLEKYSESACASIKQFVRGCKDSFNTGGWYGIMNYLLSYVRSQATISADNGILTFTDNSKLVPQQFIAGMISGAMQAVASVASIIASIASPIAGAAASLLSSVILAPIKAVSYAEANQTTARVIDSSDANKTLPYAPVAYCQLIVNRDQLNSWGVDMYDSIISNGTTYLIPVPGGAIFVGRESSESDNLSFEFHPSLNSYKWYKMFSGMHLPTTMFEPTYFDSATISAHGIRTFWQEAVIEDDLTYSNSESLVLDTYGDRKLRFAVQSNIGAFFTYLFCIDRLDTIDVSGKRLIYGLGGDSSWGSFSDNAIGLMISEALLETNLTPTPASWASIVGMASGSHSTETVGFGWYDTAQQPPEFVVADTQTFASNTSGYTNPMSIMAKSYLGAVETDFTSAMYQVVIPQYDSSTFYGWVTLGIAVVVVVSACAILATIGIKRWRMRKRAELTARTANSYSDLEKSYEDYNPDDPDDDPSLHTPEARKAAYERYRKAVRTNNFWSLITGGTKYSYAGYWDSDYSSVPAGSSSARFLNSVLFGQSVSASSGNSQSGLAVASDIPSVATTTDDIYKIITNSNFGLS